MNYSKHLFSLMMGMMALSFPSCDGIFEDIYDQPADKALYGFVEVDKAQSKGTVFVNASEYTRWIYIDFHHLAVDSINIVKGGEEYNGEWDIAVHRYDAKTNDGSVLETEYTDLEAFRNAGKLPEGEFVKDADTDSTIIIDMSHMMEGKIGYVPGKVNFKLSEWLDVDKSNMPPTYTLSKKVYVVRLKDGTKAAVKLDNFMDESYNKGVLTIKYIYPLAF